MVEPNRRAPSIEEPTFAENPLTMPGHHIPVDDEASRRSERIDEELKREYLDKKDARKREVKVMLLGQAESGKSTLQKQFQLFYDSQTLDHEKPSWRPVVYFNVIKAIRTILDELDYTGTSPSPSASMSDIHSSVIRVSSPIGNGSGDLRAKLEPLTLIEDHLASVLNGGISISGGRTGVYVRSGWQALVTPSRGGKMPDFRNASLDGKATAIAEVTEIAARALTDLVDDIYDLWHLPAVGRMLVSRKLRLDEAAAFFLDSIRRVADPDYEPTTEDVLNVRLQTLGVSEHHYGISLGGVRYNWLMYDVGGARGMRHAWVPYFDDATAIIFLAPISAFDQYLEEDQRTNRIDDSLQLFTTVCSNKLLKSAHLVLLLNKADVLKKKIAAGLKVRKYITSFGDRPNTYEEVSEYFRAHFIQVHRRKDPWQRALYAHFTSMIDITATQSIIGNVGEAVIRSHISRTGLMP